MMQMGTSREERMQNREAFIRANLGLVHSCAGRFRGRGVEYDDLYSAGCVGLIKAYDGFDTGRGVCFSTYAVPVILGEVRKLFRDGGTVKVSRSLKELGMKIGMERERAIKAGRSEPTVGQLAQQMGLRPEQVALAIRAGQPAVSLTPTGEEEGRQIDIPVDGPEEALAEQISLREVLQRLERSEQLLIFLRFYRGMTQTETAAILGTTQVQVSRRERKILDRMRSQLSGE